MDVRIKAVRFDEAEHRYWFGQKELHGVTGAIGRIMGKNFPSNDVVEIATLYGHDVHKESEMWIKEGRTPSTESGKWLMFTLIEFAEKNHVTDYEAEVLVSDFEGTASCIDIVAHTKDGAYIFDIKTTSHFDREYCSRQLSVYKYLYERCFDEKIKGMFVLGTTSRRTFKILEQSEERAQMVLKMNMEDVR